MPTPLLLSAAALTPDALWQVACEGRPVAINPASLASVAANRAALEAAAGDGLPHYGVNTGFGSFSRERINPADLRDLQRNLVRSHAAGVGDPLPAPIVRGTMLCLLSSLLRAQSGVRPELPTLIAACLNAGLTPRVPELGSVGASGDLAPLAHIALSLIGEGRVLANSGGTDGPGLASGDALRSAGLAPITLEAKEGLALINGTHLMAARAALLWVRWSRLWPAALAAACMSIDACRATDAFLDPRVYTARNQPDAAHSAAEMRRLLAGSTILPSHANADDPRVQDPYSFRCSAYVLGAARHQARAFHDALLAELGAVTDNPLVLPSHADASRADIVSAGNFHGMPIALPLDAFALVAAHVAGISERRVYHMLSAFDAQARLRPYLSPRPGLHSGLMIAQYTAAAMVNEIAGLASPATVINIPTSAGMEDYNSFGPRAAAKADRALDLATNVVAVELLCAAQAIEAHRPLRSGDGVELAHARVRGVVAPLDADRPPGPDIEAVAGIIRAGGFLPAGPGAADPA